MAAHRSGGDAIRFFKTILKSNRERLGSSQQIPNKFTKIHGDRLSNPVFMKPPDGTEWEVQWTKRNGEVWFEKGWKEFVENYSLDHGHLVFFNYEGTSQIHVLILDQTTLEIHYPSSHTREENDNLVNNVKVLDEGPDQNIADQSVQVLDEWPHQNTQIKGEGSLSMNWPKEARAQKLARKFVSCNPFFTVSIKPFNLEQYKLYVPDLKSYIGNTKIVMLQVGGESWSVKLPNCRTISGGWCLFARDNELQIRDVCIFELISTKDAVFKVHVFKTQT